MMRLSDEEITAVRNSADIAEVIGHYLPLIKKAARWPASVPSTTIMTRRCRFLGQADLQMLRLRSRRQRVYVRSEL